MGRGKVFEVISELSPLQERLYAVFENHKDQDILIDDLFVVAYGDEAFEGFSTRDKQMKLAPIFSRINEKLHGQCIEPGQLKRTYRLNTNLLV